MTRSESIDPHPYYEEAGATIWSQNAQAEIERLRHLLRVLHDDPSVRHEHCDVCDVLDWSAD